MQEEFEYANSSRLTVFTTISAAIDATALFCMKEKIKKYAEEVKGVRINYLPFVMKAVVATLKKHPAFNSYLEGKRLFLQDFYDLEVFGAVIRAADKKDMFSIASELEHGSAHTAPTFAILPYGIKGESYPALLPAPTEICVLGVSAIYNDFSLSGSGLVNNKVIYVSLVFDSNYLSMEEASGFMADLSMFMENPEISLLDS
ncbi:2-oxo acid dehydrogenase subunit E2 [Candidatus Methanomassiliicoccus intestinalis]|uniref:2-oxo acid dehydrogenase subunit E2 n=1 Tax=Candidatus Methanomassiliicoccus intestinalis TaxID=1406512 RepID=UPI0037DCE884